MDEQGWDELFGTTDTEASAGEAVTETAPPGEDVSLATAAPAESEASIPAEPESVAPVVADAAPAEEPVSEPEPEPAPVYNWREDPEAKAALEKAAKLDTIERTMAEARRIQAQRQAQQELADLSDGDAERQQRITGLIARQTAPLQHELQQASQYAGTMEKATAALHIALRAEADDEVINRVMARMETLMAVEGADTMERLAFGDRDRTRHFTEQLSAKDAQIAELQRQLAARTELAAREATKADAVDGGGGNSAPIDRLSRLEKPSSNDEFFGALFSAA